MCSGPGVVPPSMVDWFERRVLRGRRRTTDEALAEWRGGQNGDGGLREVAKLREAGSGPAIILLHGAFLDRHV